MILARKAFVQIKSMWRLREGPLHQKPVRDVRARVTMPHATHGVPTVLKLRALRRTALALREANPSREIYAKVFHGSVLPGLATQPGGTARDAAVIRISVTATGCGLELGE